MHSIFISYRRDDNTDAAHRLFDHLENQFGSSRVFIDVDSMPPGVDFRKHINDVVDKCDVMLVVIGDNWLCGEVDNRRIDNSNDFVRIEIERAFSRNVWVIPILVGHAKMPGEEDLPEPLKKLAFRNAVELRSHTGAFRSNLDRLVASLNKFRPANIKRKRGEKSQPVAKETSSVQSDTNDTTKAAKESLRSNRVLYFALAFILMVVGFIYFDGQRRFSELIDHFNQNPHGIQTQIEPAEEIYQIVSVEFRITPPYATDLELFHHSSVHPEMIKVAEGRSNNSGVLRMKIPLTRQQAIMGTYLIKVKSPDGIETSDFMFFPDFGKSIDLELNTIKLTITGN